MFYLYIGIYLLLKIYIFIIIFVLCLILYCKFLTFPPQNCYYGSSVFLVCAYMCCVYTCFVNIHVLCTYICRVYTLYLLMCKCMFCVHTCVVYIHVNVYVLCTYMFQLYNSPFILSTSCSQFRMLSLKIFDIFLLQFYELVNFNANLNVLDAIHCRILNIQRGQDTMTFIFNGIQRCHYDLIEYVCFVKIAFDLYFLSPFIYEDQDF